MNKNFGLCGLSQEECGDELVMPAKGAEPGTASIPGVLHAPFTLSGEEFLSLLCSSFDPSLGDFRHFPLRGPDCRV